MDHQHTHTGHEGHRATSLAELEHPSHGSYPGHLVPGVMFIAWSTYWLWSNIDIHLRTRAAALHAYLPLHTAANGSHTGSSKAASGSSTSSHCSTGRGEPFRSRAWYPWPYWPARHLEPICKVIFPLLGVLIELFIGWGGWRPLYAADGHFAAFHSNNWQHALMYGGMAVSGVVDLIGYHTPLPPGTEQGFLTLAFLVETLLMGSHTKPNMLDQLVHTLLTGIMISCIVVTAAGIAAPKSFLLALLRGMLVFFQGTWFWHVGSIMFRDHMAWDMNDMAAVMMIPVVFGLHILLIALGWFSVYLFMRWLYVRLGITSSVAAAAGAAKSPAAVLGVGASESDNVLDSQLEMSDYVATGSSDTRMRDVSKLKGTHGHNI